MANNQKFLTVVPGFNDLKNGTVNDVAIMSGRKRV